MLVGKSYAEIVICVICTKQKTTNQKHIATCEVGYAYRESQLFFVK